MFLAVLAFAFTSCEDDDPVNVVACFTFTPEQGIKIGDTVYFENCSSEALEYAWSFGDASTSTEAEPYHIYTEAGSFDVTLIASNGGIAETVTQKVSVSKEVVACFTVSPEESVKVGDTVYFANCSEEATSYAWDFGDSETSTEAEPFHIYSQPGTYDVSMVASKDDDSQTATSTIEVVADLSFIINYGGYSGDKSTISAFNIYTQEIENNYYTGVNGASMVSNVQYAYEYNGNIYMMGNNSDQVFWVDGKTFEQTANGITDDIVKPRNCVGNGDYLYVSCWGGDIWTDASLSYIAKVDLNSNTVEKKIPLHYGPEGLAIVGDKLYAALNYTNKVAVMDLTTEEITYIDLPAGNIPSYFEQDNTGNLYVNLGVAYGDNTTSTGIGYINTSTNQMEAKYELNGVSSMNYVDLFEFNDDFSKLYVVTTGGYMQPGGVAVFDVASESFEAEKIIDNVMGINGLGFKNNSLFCFFSESTTTNGKAVTYTEDGTKINEYETGIAPFMLLDVE